MTAMREKNEYNNKRKFDLIDDVKLFMVKCNETESISFFRDKK